MASHPVTSHGDRSLAWLLESPATAVTAIWISSIAACALAPDMVSGSEQEHLPIAWLTVWIWAALGTVYAVMTPQRESRAAWTVSVTLAWVLMAVVMAAAPVLETGSAPTRLPLAALIAPPVAAAATGLLSLRHAAEGLR